MAPEEKETEQVDLRPADKWGVRWTGDLRKLLVQMDDLLADKHPPSKDKSDSSKAPGKRGAERLAPTEESLAPIKEAVPVAPTPAREEEEEATPASLEAIRVPDTVEEITEPSVPAPSETVAIETGPGRKILEDNVPEPEATVSGPIPIVEIVPATDAGHTGGQGLVNGKGLVNGHRFATGKGLTNGTGIVNGKGLVNDRGLVNGKGLVNGHWLVNGKGLVAGHGIINGKGLVNGHDLVKGGLVNGRGFMTEKGFVNGNGIVNGPGSREDRRPLVSGTGLSDRGVYTDRMRRRRKNLGLVGAAALTAVILMVLPALFIFSGHEGANIVIDGSFGDWAGRPKAYESSNNSGAYPTIDIRTVRLYRGDSHLAFEITTAGRILQGSPSERGLDSFLLLVDADRDANTGYSAEGIGADWLIEVSGLGNRVDDVHFSRFNASRSPNDWNAWLPAGGGSACAAGTALEGEVPLKLPADPLLRVYSFDSYQHVNRPDGILSTGPMVFVRITPEAPLTAIPGEEVPLARLSLRVTSDTVLESLRAVLNTTHLQGIPFAVRLRQDDGLEGLSARDPLIAEKNTTGPGYDLPICSSISLKADSPLGLWLSVIAPPVCCTIGTEAVAVLVAKRDWPVAYESLPPAGGKEVKATIGLPSGIEIDGAFADWSHLASKGHIIGDPSGDVSGGDDADVDILQIADILETSTLDIATTVRGTELSGTVIPFETHRLGASGPQTGQTQPSAQAPPPEPRLGTDRTEIFLSTGNGMGYRTDWLIADAQYLIAIEGRNGRVISSILEKFTGASEQMWAWAPVGSIPAATGGPRIEAGVTRLLLPGISDSYSIFVRTTDWNRSHEDHAVPAVRPLLQFAIATFDPLEGLPGLPPAYVTDQASGYFVVQLDVPVTDVFLVTAEALGATALDFIPTFGMVVHLPSNDPSRLEGMDHVRWVGIHQPAFRVDPLLLERTGTLLLKVSTYQRAAEVAVQIKAAGGTIDGPAGAVMKVEADAGQLPAIAAIPDIKFIEPALTASIHNEIARGITNVNLTNTVYGLTGKGQIIAIADTGLDTGNDSDGQPDHPDFNGRVVKWYDVVRAVVSGSTGNYTSDRDNHGTHVAGTAVGGGNASNRALRGVAPEASIIVQGMEDDSGALQIYSDLHDLYSGPYTDGARVHQNSWGYTESGGKYNSDCQETDDFVWGNGTMVIVYSAGNDGKDGSGDANTTSPPGTSKNVITVGASENLRPTFDSWGDNASQVASFSSRGGTLDGRIKPDIVAPGTWILSTRSADGTSAGWGYYSQYYFYEGGTSQAAPHVSGAALLVRQYYTDYENITPSAALVKATLINGADDMGMPDIPNMNEGWGRLNLTNSLFPEKPRVMRYIDNNTGLNYSDSPVLLNFTVGRSGVPLKFSLVWSDYPGSSAAADSAPKLINDLDITVTAPNSSQYKGNVFSSGWSATGGSADKFNNVECVYITSPECGTYEVNITPANITKGPQPFALVISGELVPDLNVTNITIDPANAKSGDDVRINATIVNCGSENLPPLFKESFTGLDPGVSENITDVAFSPSGDFALLVGTNRTVVKYSTSSGTFTTLDTSGVPWTDFEAVAFNPQNHPQDRNIPEALLVGTNGTVVDYNGTGFNTVSGPASDESLLDVAWNDNGTLALIVGNGGRVYTFPNMSSVFSDDFESGDGNWQFSGNTHWANTTAQSTSPTHSMHIKTGGGSSGADNYIYLKTDQNISGSSLRSAFVEFQNRYKTPSSSGATSYDQVYISKDGSNFNLRSIFFSNSANTIGWTKEILDIYGYYPTATFNILFYQTSDSGAPKGDWWIDDVHINKTVYAAASLSSLDSSAVLHGVQFVPGTDDAIMVGDGGIAWKYSGGTLSSLTSGTASDLRALSFKPQNSTCIIVGANGTVMRYLGNNDTFSNLSFPDSNASFWDVAYRQDFSVSGPKPDCSQALLVGASGTAWQYFGYDDHFNNVSVAETKTFYGVAFNNTRYPLYGPGLLVGYGSGPVVNKDSPEMTFRPFLVDFYTDNSSYSSNWLGRVQVDGGLAPDPYPPWGVNVTVSFLWTGAPSGSHNITVRVDITNNESASPPSPDRINEVEEWTNNQMSMNLLLVPEFNSVLAPLLCVFAGFALFRRMGFKKRGRAASFKHRPSRFGPSRGPGTQPRRIF